MNTKRLIDEAAQLPVEKRTLVVDFLLRSLNQPESKIDEDWAKEAQKRLDELRTGKIEAISGDEVFAKVRKRFEK